MTRTLVYALLVSFVISGCYHMRPSAGGGQVSARAERAVNAADIALPDGYSIEAVATGLTFPTGVTFDSNGAPCVVESGYAYGEKWTMPRLLRIGSGGQISVICEGGRNGPWTGVTFHDGSFFVAEGGVLEGGRILRIPPGGEIEPILENLPSQGDHHTNGPVIGPDGWLYFGQGTFTNSAVVGTDNHDFGWLKRLPQLHDIPGTDIALTGENFKTKNPLKGGRAVTGAFVPFGTPTTKGQVIRGQIPCNGAIMRVQPEGGPPELVAWGFRNPFGLAFSPDEKLYATDNMYDDRGSRPIWGTGDLLWQVNRGSWYGWPDYHAGRLLKKPVIANPPGKPPRPVAILGVHSSCCGLDFSRNPAFGHVGEAFIAQFGDQAPVVGKVLTPVGFKVVRVDVKTGVIEEFAVNKGKLNGPASRVGGGGLERPVAARFSPDGTALYVVDFGMMRETSKHSIPVEKTGVVWWITRMK